MLGHLFVLTSFSIPTYCEYCNSLIWVDKGQVCKSKCTHHSTTNAFPIHVQPNKIRGKKILKFSLVPRASKVKFLLFLLPNNLSEMYCQINLQ